MLTNNHEFPDSPSTNKACKWARWYSLHCKGPLRHFQECLWSSQYTSRVQLICICLNQEAVIGCKFTSLIPLLRYCSWPRGSVQRHTRLMLQIQDHLSFPSTPWWGDQIHPLLWLTFLTGKPFKTDMLFIYMSLLWTQSGLVAKRPSTLHWPTQVQSSLLEKTDYSKSDNIKIRKTVAVQIKRSSESTERSYLVWK